MDETDKDFVPADGPAAKRPTASRARPGEKPRWRLLTPQYINDRYYGEDIEIIYAGTPNEGMEPMNAAAEEAMEAWIESLPSKPMRHEDFIANAIANRPRYEVPTPAAAPRKRASRVIGKDTAEDAEVEVIPPDLTRVKGPKKQMGTIVAEVPSPGSI